LFSFEYNRIKNCCREKECWQTASRNPPGFELKALFEADRSESLSTRLSPFSTRAKGRGMPPRLT
jgi:hypothetical protein